jgi:hypothetical protein
MMQIIALLFLPTFVAGMTFYLFLAIADFITGITDVVQ